MKHDVVFATPSLSNQICSEFFASAIDTDRLCMANGLAPAWIQLGGDPYLAKVRCKLMNKFLVDFPEAHSFFFLDDDIGWPAHKAVEFALNPNPVLAGIYPKKSENLAFPVVLAGDANQNGAPIVDAGFYLAREVPTGFLRLRREVVQKLADTSQPFRDLVGDQEVAYPEFCKMGTDTLDSNGWWVGEDYDLSRRIIALGFDIWVDPNIEFTHRGTKLWRNSLGEHIHKFGPAKEAVR